MPHVHRLSGLVDLPALHQSNPARYPYLLQSTAQSSHHAHVDILFACPMQTLVLQSQHDLALHLAAQGEWEPNKTQQHKQLLPDGDFLRAFDQCWRAEQVSGEGSRDETLPFTGGWFLYLGYELAQQIEPSLALPVSADGQLPIAFATRIPAAVIINRQTNEAFAVAEAGQQHCLSTIQADLARLGDKAPAHSANLGPGVPIIQSIDEDPAERYIHAVTEVKRYIRDGDVFQVNLSRLWRAQLDRDISSLDIFQRLMQSNPAPFSALALFGNNAIMSSSPERLVRVYGDRVETRPIAGTRPRGASLHDDQNNLQELIGHPKERAEHIMLIDLERNDLGRVCIPGSVHVNELMALESYAHVHHIVSNVQGRLRADINPSDVIRAVFPGGTITGCPKVRCMEIIAELEQAPRGAYTGSLGYVNHDGSMDMNILIRTLVRRGDQVTLRAGAGIVADSEPESELQETRAKAKGLLLAL